MVVEVIHDQLAQIIGCLIRVQILEKFSESFNLSIISGVDDMPLDVTWNELRPDASQEGGTVVAKIIFSTIAVDECICEPAWVEGRQPMEYLVNERVCVPDIDRSS